ncbi:hypothetical protein KC842_02295 [Candidatus Nomurabacteria bacterium]|nr:hypothetical protein [Candidatus Nomurabacteria bacterium]
MNVNKKFGIKILSLFLLMFSFSSALFFVPVKAEFGTSEEDASTLDFQLNNPLSDEINSIPVLISKILDIVIFIMVPIITLMVIYTGFMFVVARGKPAELEKAKKALMWTLIGAAIILGAWTLAEVLGGTIDCLKPGVTC